MIKIVNKVIPISIYSGKWADRKENIEVHEKRQKKEKQNDQDVELRLFDLFEYSSFHEIFSIMLGCH